MPTKSESFSDSFKNKLQNYPDTGKFLLFAFHIHWKELSGFPGKSERFHGKFSYLSWSVGKRYQYCAVYKKCKPWRLVWLTRPLADKTHVFSHAVIGPPLDEEADIIPPLKDQSKVVFAAPPMGFGDSPKR